MTKNVLLVGLDYTGPTIPGANINVLGLCRSKICEEKAARCLYEYDVIIINPESYSHFIFGQRGKHSESRTELWDLKKENNDYDLDTIYNSHDRQLELNAAIEQGSRVIWLLVPDKKIFFFGERSLYLGYANSHIEKIISNLDVKQKNSKQLSFSEKNNPFQSYFKQLQTDGWKICISNFNAKINSIAQTPEGYSLGCEIKINKSIAWLLTAPTTQASANSLILSAIELKKEDTQKYQYHGIFLCHTSADKPFVRKLKKSLEQQGVEQVWLDDSEIDIGDSLIKKIEEGIKKSKYFGIILSPRSINSNWVKKELEIAFNREISNDEVVILPLLYEKCELPSLLANKFYSDFTTASNYEESLGKLLRRLKIK